MVRFTSIEWATSKEELAEQDRADAARQQDALDFQFALVKRQAERVRDATEFQIETDLDMAKLSNASEDELKHMALNSEIRFIDAREEAKRRLELEELDHQIKFLDLERKTAFGNAIANAQHKTELLALEKQQHKLDIEMAAMRELHLQEMKKSGAFSELEVTGLVQKQQREHIAGLQEIDLRGEQVRAEIKRVEEDAKRAHEIGKLKINEGMSPEQILAISAGLSPNVATILVEQAKAKATVNEDSMALMREMVEAATAAQIRSEEQARNMFQMGMQGAVGVAAGAGGGEAAADSVGGGGATPAGVDCAKCSTSNPATFKFCKKCGNKLRT